MTEFAKTALRPDLDLIVQAGRLTEVDVSEPTQTEKNLEHRRRQRREPRLSEEDRQKRNKRRIPLPVGGH